MSSWRLIDSGVGTGPWNMALDEAIFESVRAGVSPPTLRVYRWSPPALTIGYSQDRDRDVDRAACHALGIDVVRRVTGGRAVLHDAEVTYSVSAPAGLAGFGPGLLDAYRHVAAGLVAGLRLLGMDAVSSSPVARAKPGVTPGPGCFSAVGAHEIVAAGRKLVGSAQRRAAGAFLQQGSILVKGHGERLERVLRGVDLADSRMRMVGLAELLSPCPGPDEIVAAIVHGCSGAWGVRFAAGEPARLELRRASALEAERFRSEAWNASRRPVTDAPRSCGP